MSSSTTHKLRDQVGRRKWDSSVRLLREFEPAVAARFLLELPFEDQRILFRKLPPAFASSLLSHFPYYHAYVLLQARPPEELRNIVDGMKPADRENFLDELPEEAWQYLMDEWRSRPEASPTQPSPAPKKH